jgi:MFS family permease
MSESSPSISNISPNAPTLHAHRLLWAGFMAILAEGVGFAVRGGILGQWAQQYGFTNTELGLITGGGLTGFGVIIILSSLIADKVGYGTLMFGAFVLHGLSAVVTLGAGMAFASGGKTAALHCLIVGMFLFAMGNGLCEGVANPLVASLFPGGKAKYLNILHAGWPGGLILGALASYFMSGGAGDPVKWQIQMCLFLIPVAIYGLMLLGQKFPKSEAKQHGVKYTDMLKELGMGGALILCFLLARCSFIRCKAMWSWARTPGSARLQARFWLRRNRGFSPSFTFRDGCLHCGFLRGRSSIKFLLSA